MTHSEMKSILFRLVNRLNDASLQKIDSELSDHLLSAEVDEQSANNDY